MLLLLGIFTVLLGEVGCRIAPQPFRKIENSEIDRRIGPFGLISQLVGLRADRSAPFYHEVNVEYSVQWPDSEQRSWPADACLADPRTAVAFHRNTAEGSESFVLTEPIPSQTPVAAHVTIDYSDAEDTDLANATVEFIWDNPRPDYTRTDRFVRGTRTSTLPIRELERFLVDSQELAMELAKPNSAYPSEMVNLSLTVDGDSTEMPMSPSSLSRLALQLWRQGSASEAEPGKGVRNLFVQM